MNLTPHHKQARKHQARVIKGVFLCGFTSLGSAEAASYRMNSYVMIGTQIKPAFAWCDAKDRLLAVTAPNPGLIGPEDVREVSLLRWLKNKPSDMGNFRYKLGLSEGAAGSTYTGLVPAGFKATRELAEKYFVHLSNVQRPPAYRMAQVVRFNTPQGENRCRYVPNAAFMGATSKRTVIVWDEGDTITYATRNFDGKPGVYVTGGRKIRSVEGGTTYQFSTEDGFTYHVWVDDIGPGTGSKVVVTRNGKMLTTEHFLTYSVSTVNK